MSLFVKGVGINKCLNHGGKMVSPTFLIVDYIDSCRLLLNLIVFSKFP